MAYSNQDKYDFAVKDVKYAIGQGMGNSFSKAVDVAIAGPVEGTHEDFLKVIETWRDKFFASNQEAIQTATEEWFKKNDKKLKMKLGLIDRVIDANNPDKDWSDVPVID